MKQWFVVNTKIHKEKKAMTNLNQQGFNTYLPRYRKSRRHARRTDIIMAPLFPKYLFVEFDLGMQNWSRINSTFGVNKLIKFGSTPTPLSQKLIDDIRAREDASGIISVNRFLNIKKGDAITITNGAFNDHRGIFECQDDDARVIILLNLMGRNVRVRIPSTDISA
tara:strand:- start:16170 stop:16667 length:498 start_codon:yes stop_codon:yes gene_type:complete